MDGPNYLKLLQTGRLDPKIPAHRKVLEENLGPLAKILADLGLDALPEKATEPVTPVVETTESNGNDVVTDEKPKGRKKKAVSSLSE